MPIVIINGKSYRIPSTVVLTALGSYTKIEHVFDNDFGSVVPGWTPQRKYTFDWEEAVNFGWLDPLVYDD